MPLAPGGKVRGSRWRISTLTLGASLMAIQLPVIAQAASSRPDPLGAFGCPSCHDLGGIPTTIRDEAPPLGGEGARVRPEWLYEFLREPERLRPWLAGRMPDFRLTDRQALAITTYLRALIPENERADWPGTPLPTAGTIHGSIEAGRTLASTKYFDCFTCHIQGDVVPDGSPEDWAPDLARSRARLNPDWIMRWLRDPQAILPDSNMPAYFPDEESGPEEILGGDENRQAAALRDYVLSIGEAQASVGYGEARAAYPDVMPEEGARLVREFNCAGCHDIPDQPRDRTVAPVLQFAGNKFQPAWLESFLLEPHRLRPAGYHLGSVSVMPTFRFTQAEADSVVEALSRLVDPDLPGGEVEPLRPLTRIEKFRADKLFLKWSCVGCHRIATASGKTIGGYSGPTLLSAGTRLRPDFIREYIRSPRSFEPDGRMVVLGDRLPKSDLNLLVRAVGGMNSNVTVETQLTAEIEWASGKGSSSPPRLLFARYCAQCHGPGGAGDGVNSFGDVEKPPKDLTNGQSVARLKNEQLRDVITNGGPAIGLSSLMPPWGDTLGRMEVQQLVDYVRELCQCSYDPKLASH